jgi:erythronate-4-phosphate dehydrogenase
MNILADVSLPGLDSAFPQPFHLTLYSHPDEIPFLLKSQQILLCRSTLKVDEHLLGASPKLAMVATASSGRDHLDEQFLKTKGIQIIDARGANARSVADYVLACIAYLDKTNILKGKQLGIIGFGFVGQAVSIQMQALGFKVLHYDPPKAAAERHFKSATLTALTACDLLCIHASLHQDPPYPSQDLLNQTFLSSLSKGTVIINASRGGILHEEALLTVGKHLVYCTDVYLNEPDIDPRIIKRAFLCTPHIAGHSIEAKFGAIALISQKLHRLLHLTPVVCETPKPIPPQATVDLPWQDQVLAQYHPLHETNLLKNAANTMQAFLQIRALHQNRHNLQIVASVS